MSLEVARSVFYFCPIPKENEFFNWEGYLWQWIPRTLTFPELHSDKGEKTQKGDEVWGSDRATKGFDDAILTQAEPLINTQVSLGKGMIRKRRGVFYEIDALVCSRGGLLHLGRNWGAEPTNYTILLVEDSTNHWELIHECSLQGGAVGLLLSLPLSQI